MIDYTKIFHTVPIKSDIMTRSSNGAKVDSKGKTIQFLGGGWKQYQDTRNTNNTPLLGAIAGKDFIGIDIDTDAVFNHVIALLDSLQIMPTYIAKSLPASLKKGGHILFKYTKHDYEQLIQIRKYLKKHVHIDIQMDALLIYLATPANKTKELVTEPITDINDLIPIPEELLIYLQGLATKYIIADMNKMKDSTPTTITTGSITNRQTDYYGYILDNDELTPDIVARLTPKRDYPEVVTMDDITHGNGTDWMLQVRKKLQTDKSVSAEVMTKTMLYLNSLWSEPMPISRVEQDIARDINSPDFVYSSTWKTDNLILTTDMKHTIEVLFNPYDASYLLFNRTLQEVTKYLTYTMVSDVLMSLTGRKLPKDIILKRATKVNVVTTPLHEPFIQQPKAEGLPLFNNFIPSEGLLILREPEKVTNYRTPYVILDFLTNLIPDKATRDKFIAYIATKYSTYDYSPLYFVMAGVGGAGKGLLVHEILTYLSSEQRVHSVDFKALTNNFNSFMASIDWLELEEAGEGYTHKENEKLVGTLKRITGNANISIERKGKDAVTQRHFITPIISTNLNTKLITDTVTNDRRLVLLRCPNKLTELLPYTVKCDNCVNGIKSGSKCSKCGSVVIDSTRMFIHYMRKELPLFASYLGRQYKTSPLPSSDYLDNATWKGVDYADYVEDTLTEHEKLYQAAESRDLSKFIDILLENRVPKDQIDMLFNPISNHEHASIVLYNTASTDELGYLSLEDIYLDSNTLLGNPRTDYKRVKYSKTERKNFKVYKLQTIVFKDTYTPIGDIQPISTTNDQVTEELLRNQ